jgi:cell division protein FtsB
MNLFKSKFLTVLIIAGIGWLSLSFFKIRIHNGLVDKEVANLELKISNLKKSNSSLEKFIEYIKHPAFLEREARAKLNLKTSGEKVAFIYSDDGSKTSSDSVDFDKQLALFPNYLKWIYYLLGY